MSTLLGEFDPSRTTRPEFKGVQHNALDDAAHAHRWLCDLRDAIPRMIDESRKTSGLKIWECKIGEVPDTLLAPGVDLPMRHAVTAAYKAITGEEPKFLFSGWAGSLDKFEREVVNSKN